MSRTGIFSLRNNSAVPPVEMMSTPCRSSSRANLAMPLLSETEMSAREIFIREARSTIAERSLRSVVDNHVLCRRIQHRTATNRFAKCFAEMAETRVANFGRGFGHVVTTGAQQFSRAFHSQFPKVLRNRQTDFARETPAQIKRTAANFLTE